MKSYHALQHTLLATTILWCACNHPTTTHPENDSTRVPAFDVTAMDTTVNPCENFDQYVSGNWKKNNPIPATESHWGSFVMLDKQNKDIRLKSILQNIAEKKDLKKGTEEQQIADFYRSFMDTATIAQLGIQPIQPYLNQITGIQSLADWIKVSGQLQNLGISTVVGFYVSGDARNSKMNALYEAQDGLTLEEKNYYEKQDPANKNIREELVKHIDKQFSQAGFGEVNPGKTILDFETKVATLQQSNVQLRNPIATYNKVAYGELKKLAPQFDWDGFLAVQDLKSDTLILQNKSYLRNIALLIKATPLEVLKTYARWKTLQHFAGYLNKAIDQENFHFFGTIISGAKVQKPRQERAIRTTDAKLGMPLGKLFVKQYFPESSKQRVSEMIENVRTVYGERVDSLKWMSAETKKKAHEKLASFTYKIGYPDKWKDYSSINIQPGKLIENVVAVTLFSHKETIDKLGKPVDKTEWDMYPQTTNAYCNGVNNEIVFPAAILQPPFFNPDADDAINYGSIIAVIGHEITHGFDDEGSQYGADGNLTNWWTPQDRKNFMDLANRYVRYFNSIEVLPGYHINGELTLGENIADLGGLTLAYYALQKSLKGKPTPAKIDGFTWQQRFFLGWAQVGRGMSTEAGLRNQIQTDPHSPETQRVNGPLSHMREFTAAWGCKGGKMDLPDTARVVIW